MHAPHAQRVCALALRAWRANAFANGSHAVAANVRGGAVLYDFEGYGAHEKGPPAPAN